MSTTPEDRVSFMMCEHGEVKSTFVMSGIDGVYPALRRFIFQHVSPRRSRPGGLLMFMYQPTMLSPEPHPTHRTLSRMQPGVWWFIPTMPTTFSSTVSLETRGCSRARSLGRAREGFAALR